MSTTKSTRKKTRNRPQEIVTKSIVDSDTILSLDTKSYVIYDDMKSSWNDPAAKKTRMTTVEDEKKIRTSIPEDEALITDVRNDFKLQNELFNRLMICDADKKQILDELCPGRYTFTHKSALHVI